MPKTVLIVTKDMMPFNIYHPVAEMLKGKGVTVHIVAEGLSMKKWMDAGWPIVSGWPGENSFDPGTKIRFDIHPEKTLESLKPDVIMVGLDNPIHLSESFALAANNLGIRLGFVEESIWFTHRRSKAIPNFVCVPDSFGKKVVNEYYSNAAFKPEVFITGVPSMDSLQSLKPDSFTAEVVERAGCKRVILIIGQMEATTSFLLSMKDVLDQMEGCLIIPRLHPKLMNNPDMAGLKSTWLDLIYKMERRHRIIWTPEKIPTNTLIPLATEVVGSLSNLLVDTVALGGVPVSWTSSELKDDMRRALGGHDSFPLVDMGAAIGVETSEDYLEKVVGMTAEERSGFVARAQDLLKIDFKAAKRVVEAILS